MRIGLYLKSRLAAYRRELWIVVFSALSLFLTVALWSYNPHDPSWFYYTSQHSVVTNWCGVWGANSAALLWYMMGLGAWLVPGILLLSILFFIWHGSVSRCWERIIAACCMLAVCSIVLSGRSVSWLYGRDLGGAMGLFCYNHLYALVGAVGTWIVAATLFILAAIIALRISHHDVRYIWGMCLVGMRASYRLGVLLSSYIVTLCVVCIYRPLIALKCYGQYLLSGAWYEHSALIIPKDEYVQDSIGDMPGSTVPLQPVQLHEPIRMQTATSAAHGVLPEQDTIQDSTQDTIAPYELPSLSLFIAQAVDRTSAAVKQELEVRAHALEEKLRCFGITGSVVEIKRGPVVTVFEYLPAIDTKLSKIVSLEDDLAMALQALSIRILAPIPGTAVVGFEVANKKRHDVLFASVIKSAEFVNGTHALPLVLGKDTVGTDVIVDLARMPHLLIAGSTGSGKSIALNAMLISLLCKRTPDEMRLVLIDPKRLEFASYADIAHLLFPIVTEAHEASPVLAWVVQEMERRYEQMAVCGVRNVSDYNRCTKHISHTQPLPYIVVVIDELADLMMTAGREVEELITRTAQMARAAGIHMIVATQRPSVDVITGLIKVNFPSRISFRVTAKIDSRTILDCSGADKLLGRGDMLFLDATTACLRRVHGAYITAPEIEAVVEHIRAERMVQYLDIAHDIIDAEQKLNPADDHLYAQVIDFLSEADEISISLLQRKFKIGYNRSARIIEFLELKGMILPSNGTKTRKVVR